MLQGRSGRYSVPGWGADGVLFPVEDGGGGLGDERYLEVAMQGWWGNEMSKETFFSCPDRASSTPLPKPGLEEDERFMIVSGFPKAESPEHDSARHSPRGLRKASDAVLRAVKLRAVRNTRSSMGVLSY